MMQFHLTYLVKRILLLLLFLEVLFKLIYSFRVFWNLNFKCDYLTLIQQGIVQALLMMHSWKP